MDRTHLVTLRSFSKEMDADTVPPMTTNSMRVLLRGVNLIVHALQTLVKVALCSCLVSLWTWNCLAQDLQKQADKAIENEDYKKAVVILEKMVGVNPSNAEAWYSLGHAIHWMCYDSVPLKGYDRSLSDRILSCMNKALGLNPNLRDCYSVIGSEYGARAEYSLQNNDWSEFTSNLKSAWRARAIPPWLLEYSRNLLNSCGQNAILFTGGDAEVFPVWYCQYVDSIRTDVILCPIPLLDRPWFAKLLKTGFAGHIAAVPLAWSGEQLGEMHIAKWQTQNVELAIPPTLRRKFGIKDSVFSWVLPPDIQRDGRGYLGINRIILLGLIQANNWERPVHFSMGCHPWMFSNLNDHLRYCGMTLELVPISANVGKRSINLSTTMNLIEDSTNFSCLTSLKDQDIPYVSSILQNYRLVYLRACDSLLQAGKMQPARVLLTAMDTCLPDSILPTPAGLRNMVADLRRKASVSKP